MEVIATTALNQAILTLVAAIASAAFGAALATLKKRTAQDRAMSQIMKAIGRKEIMDDYQSYIVDGKHLTVERYEQLTEIYEAYAALGGNGTAKRMYEEITAKRPWVVTD